MSITSHPPVFSREWFEYYQDRLLLLVNHPLTRHLMRRILRLRKGDIGHREDIVEIQPNAVTIYNGLVNGQHSYTRSFRAHDKFAKRLFYSLTYVWQAMHWFDTRIANPYVPELNLGFDTLGTVYPDAGSGSTSVDGWAQYLNAPGFAWYGIHDQGTGTTAGTTDATRGWVLNHDVTAAEWNNIRRLFFHFDTSGLPDGATVTAADFALYCVSKQDDLSLADTTTTAVVASTAAADNNIVTADFDAYGTTLFATALAYNSTSTSAYNTFSLNASGLAAISDSGVTKFAVLEGTYDLTDTDPTGVNAEVDGIVNIEFSHADETGTSQDPKLDITYAGSDPTRNSKTHPLGIGLGIRNYRWW